MIQCAQGGNAFWVNGENPEQIENDHRSTAKLTDQSHEKDSACLYFEFAPPKLSN
jgi:hypothetical protein